MTFEEVENLLLEQNLDDAVASLVVYEMSILKETYAPTVEMTKEQARVFQIYYDSERPFNKSELEYPYNLFMSSIKEKDLIKAWLRPETIKIVNETVKGGQK